MDGNKIITTARRYLGSPYQDDFTCLDFVRTVYAKHGFTVPPIELNLQAKDLENPPIGFVLYLRRRGYSGDRRWTHVTIVVSATECIHCSHYFGDKVVITPLKDVLSFYDIA